MIGMIFHGHGYSVFAYGVDPGTLGAVAAVSAVILLIVLAAIR